VRRAAPSSWRGPTGDWADDQLQQDFSSYDDDTFAFRISSVVQTVILRTNRFVANSARVLIYQFNLDLPEPAVAFFIRGLLFIASLALLKLVLSIFLGLFIVGLIVLFVYHVVYRSIGRSGNFSV